MRPMWPYIVMLAVVLVVWVAFGLPLPQAD